MNKLVMALMIGAMSLLTACGKDVNTSGDGDITIGTPTSPTNPANPNSPPATTPPANSVKVEFANHGDASQEVTTRRQLTQDLTVTLPLTLSTNQASKSSHTALAVTVNNHVVCYYTWQSGQYKRYSSETVPCLATMNLLAGDQMSMNGLDVSEVITLWFTY